MLGNFLGKNHKPGPPKNQIEVVCPICGAAQYEPRLVVTTLCRSCGEHLRIEKKRVVASSKINPIPSAVFPAADGNAPKETPKPSDFRERQPISEPVQQMPPSAPDVPSALASDSEEPFPAPAASQGPAGLGQMMGLGAPEESQGESNGSVLQRLRQRKPVQGQMPEAANEGAPAPAPMTASTLQKMKEQGYYRQQYFKDVECFDCQHKFKVGRSAKSTNCPTCGVYICLEDFEINQASSNPILTRGDVIIRKNGNVNTSNIKCRDLRIFGTVSAKVDCSGDCILRTSGTLIGEIHCRKLVVEKGSDIRLINTVHAHEVDVQARIVGNIWCDGPLNISSHGTIQGDVTARSVSIEPGGQLDGAMNIMRSSKPRPPAKP